MRGCESNRKPEKPLLLVPIRAEKPKSRAEQQSRQDTPQNVEENSGDDKATKKEYAVFVARADHGKDQSHCNHRDDQPDDCGEATTCCFLAMRGSTNDFRTASEADRRLRIHRGLAVRADQFVHASILSNLALIGSANGALAAENFIEEPSPQSA